MPNLRLLTIDPAHFHAALVQKEMYSQIDAECHVYAPLGADALTHLQRIAGFNARSQHPTHWDVNYVGASDFLQRALREKPGNVVVLAGRNASKIDTILAAIEAGLHVLADKPWVLKTDDLPKLQRALDLADAHGLIAYDIMTERFEITSILQGELLRDESIFGRIVPGSEDQPAIYYESVHYLKKTVAGAPLRRPASFFDVDQQGEALSDVGTHLVDIIPWLLYPEEGIDHTSDIKMLAAKRWPTQVSRNAFQQITGEADFPTYLANHIHGENLAYFCNSQVQYVLRGSHVKLDVLWDFEASPGAGDTQLASFKGTRSTIEIRQGREELFIPELFVVPNSPDDTATIQAALERRITKLLPRFAGLSINNTERGLHIHIPPALRTSHETHFSEVTRQFLSYVQKEQELPAWEKPCMLAKYFVTTTGVELGREQSTP